MAVKKLIPSLTALRFFFAFMVFLAHTIVQQDTPAIKLIHPYMREGFLGVSFFFILSGFILAYNYQDKLLNKEVAHKDFFAARLGRIWPVHIVTLLLTLPLDFINGIDNSIIFYCLKFIINALLLQSLIPVRDIFFSFNVPSWSISDEMIFYLLLPFLIVYLTRNKYRYWSTILYYVFFIVTLLLFYKYCDKPTQRAFFYINPVYRIADFIIGILLFQLYKYRSIANIYSSQLKASLFEVLSLAMLGVFFVYHKHVHELFRFSFYYWLPMMAVIFSFSYCNGIISRLLSARIFLLLGEISFSFYMIHQVVIDYMRVINERFLHLHYLPVAIINFVIVLILSYLSFKLIEKPAAQYVRQILGSAGKKQSGRQGAIIGNK